MQCETVEFLSFNFHRVPDGLLAEAGGRRVRIGQNDSALDDKIDGLAGVAEDLDSAGIVHALQGNIVCGYHPIVYPAKI